MSLKIGGSRQWPPPKNEEDQGLSSTYIDPNQLSSQQSKQVFEQQQHQQSQQVFQQQQQSQQVFQQQQQLSQQVFPQQQQQKPVSILKHSQQTVAEPLLSAQQSAEQSFQAGPGQNVTVPRRGKGELQQQKPGMRVPICGACDGQIRCKLSKMSAETLTKLLTA